jgi:hypothetical protein
MDKEVVLKVICFISQSDLFHLFLYLEHPVLHWVPSTSALLI